MAISYVLKIQSNKANTIYNTLEYDYYYYDKNIDLNVKLYAHNQNH